MALPDPNPFMLQAKAAILLKYPGDVVNLGRECDVNELGEYGAHAWNDALDHWGKGWFAHSHMDTVAKFAVNNADAYQVWLVLWNRYAFRRENGFVPERLPTNFVQHTDHVHIEFMPRRFGTPPGCPVIA